MKGFPHIASAQAAHELGYELVEVITSQGYVVVPVEEFVRDHRSLQSDLWGQLSAQSVGASISNLPSPLHRHALSQWNPNPGNPFAARRSPQMPCSLKQTIQAACLHDIAEQGRLENEEKSETKNPQN